MDLGYSQFRQIIFGVGGLFLGPLMLLILYVRLLYKAKEEGKPCAKISDMPPNKSPEPTAVSAFSSAVAVHVTSRRWLSFFR